MSSLLTGAGRGRIYPASAAQRRFVLLDRLADEPLYQIADAVRIRGPLDRRTLEDALAVLQRRHGIFRTTLHELQGEIWQLVADALTLPVETAEAVGADREAAARAALRGRTATCFDLTGSGHRFVLVTLDEDDHVFALIAHHALWDGESSQLFHEELAETYRALAAGQPRAVDERRPTYGELALAERRAAGEWAGSLAYWRERLHGASPVVVPYDFDPGARPVAGRRVAFDLGAAVRDASTSFTAQAQVLPLAPLLAAWAALTFHHTGEDDLAFGIPIAGRYDEEAFRVLGAFVNTVVLRRRVTPGRSFRQSVEQANDDLREALEHGRVPFDAVVGAVRPERTAGSSSLFGSLFALRRAPGETFDYGDAEAERFESPLDASEFPLSGLVEDDGRRLALHVDYRSDLYAEATPARIADEFCALLLAGCRAPETSVEDLLAAHAAPSRAPAGVYPDVRSAPPLVVSAPEEPLTELESTVAEAFAAVLETSDISRNDNFFELGGTSLMTMQLLDELRGAGFSVHPRDVFMHQTVGALAASLATSQTAASAPPDATSVVG
jgi:hypothetical protein